ncbi:uncharacterized protein METZ01_LOCUS476598, partial [marine metagenome]
VSVRRRRNRSHKKGENHTLQHRYPTEL